MPDTNLNPRPTPEQPRRNVELKVRLANLAAAQRIATELTGGPSETVRQVDTYFRCAHGRLKLREVSGRPGQLIAYHRPDQSGMRTSHYRLVEVADAAGLHAALAEALGVLVVVDKRREIFLYENVRIHLDRVERLGEFLEFEAVLGPSATIAEGEEQVRKLSGLFGLSTADMIAGSYSDLLLGENA